MNLERVRSHPARYLVPWSMTVARPVLGWKAMKSAQSGNWAQVQKHIVPALASDLEGNPARFLRAVSVAGAVADPVADAMLRAESVVAFAPHMSKIATVSVVAGEFINFGINAKIQKALEKPRIPKGAKIGAVVQAVGAGLFTEGMKQSNEKKKKSGESIIVAGTLLRVSSYVNLYRRTRKETS